MDVKKKLRRARKAQFLASLDRPNIAANRIETACATRIGTRAEGLTTAPLHGREEQPCNQRRHQVPQQAELPEVSDVERVDVLRWSPSSSPHQRLHGAGRCRPNPSGGPRHRRPLRRPVSHNMPPLPRTSVVPRTAGAARRADQRLSRELHTHFDVALLEGQPHVAHAPRPLDAQQLLVESRLGHPVSVPTGRTKSSGHSQAPSRRDRRVIRRTGARRRRREAPGLAGSRGYLSASPTHTISRRPEKPIVQRHSPRRQFVGHRLKLVTDSLNAVDLARPVPRNQPLPKGRAEIEPVVQVLRSNEDVGVKQVRHSVPQAQTRRQPVEGCHPPEAQEPKGLGERRLAFQRTGHNRPRETQAHPSVGSLKLEA